MPPIPASALRTDERLALCRTLQDVYDKLCEEHAVAAPRNGIPVGGGDWMDSFFRMEAIRGTQTALRAGRSLSAAVQFGKDCSSVAVRLWNSHREYQVHRWEQTAYDFLDSTIRRLRS